MLNLIENNPYRILGVYANASLKEITANKSKLARYASVGKKLSYEADMEVILSPIHRTDASIDKAFADLSLPQDKLKHALFWFMKDNALDETALGHLNAGDLDKAEELFGKHENWSGMHNAGVLALIRSDWGKAIGCLTRVIHISDYRTALVKAVCGDTYQIEESDLARLFVDSMRAIRPANELYTLFSVNGYTNSDADYLRDSMTDEPKEKLNAEISKVKAVEDDGVTLYEAGVAFQQNAQPLLKQLEEWLGADSMEYKLLVDKYATALLECCIDSFNALFEEIAGDEADLFEEYAPKIKTLIESIDTAKVSDVVKDRVETNLKNISEVVENLDVFVQSNSRICFYCGKRESDPSSMYIKTMYRETGRYTSGDYGSGGTTQVGIARCKRCEKIHGIRNTIANIVFVLTVVGSIIFVSSKQSVWAGLLIGWIPGVFLNLVLETLLDGIFRLLFNTKKEDNVCDHASIKKKIDEGWSLSEPKA